MDKTESMVIYRSVGGLGGLGSEDLEIIEGKASSLSDNSATDSEQAYYFSDLNRLNRPGTEWADVIYNISGVFLVSGVEVEVEAWEWEC